MADKNIENVKILVGYHFPAKILHDSILTPINAGRALIKDSHTDTAKWLSANTIGDDTGDNISLKNRTYNEMTAIYWAWKNQDKLGYPEAIGYQHYRRHLIFDGPILSPRKYPYPAMFPKYGSDGTGGYLKKVGYSEATVRRMVAEYPCIVSYGYNRRKTIYEQYEHNYMCSGQYIQDLDFIAEYIKTKHPEYSDATDRYIHGHDQFFGNIFILHKVLFDRYCAFMFDVLEAFECRIDPEVRSFSENRFYVSERITGIFVTKLIEEGVAVKKLPVSLVSNEAEFIPPSPSANNAVNVVSAAGAKDLPYLAVTLTSLKEHISSGVQYDIFVLHAGISGEELANFERDLAAPENLKLRFINILPLLLELEQFDGNGQECRAWTKFIPAMMGRIFKGFDRILYLDPQLIVLKDIAELCKTDLQNKPLGAVPDLKQFYLEKTRLRSEGKLSEISEIGNRPGDAVLIYDLNALSQEDLSEKYINLLNNSNNLAGGGSAAELLYAVFRDRLFWLDTSWCVAPQLPAELTDFRTVIPETSAATYAAALKAPRILRFSNVALGLQRSDYPYAGLWWTTARKSIYYERLLHACLSVDVLDCSKTEADTAGGTHGRQWSKLIKYRLLNAICLGLVPRFKERYEHYRSAH